ncbi:histidine triad nucleotide-binding protein [candidate division KSB1 bacterium]|nr:histidine triad nucleotide-binding protein [candidate division KSB1 bacterium]
MNCLFCGIAQEEIPARIIYKDDDVMAFHDISPKAPYHILIIPRKHIATLNDMREEDIPLVGKIIHCAKEIAAQIGIAERGYRLILNCNDEGGQVIYHLHCHLLGGRRLRDLREFL